MKKGWITGFIVATFNLFLMAQASAEVATSINGELRFRPEYRDNSDFNKAAADTQSFYGQRIRLGVDAKISPDLGALVQIQDTRNWGEEGGTASFTDGNEKLDLHQANVTLKNINGSPLSLKVGRQELGYGDQRLVGSLGWSNRGRAFDAIKLSYGTDIADIDFWTAKVVENNGCTDGVAPSTSFCTGKADNNTDFYGLYAIVKSSPVPDSNLQAYLLYKRDGADANGNGEIDLSEYTLGARLAGKVSGVGVDYTGEFAYQLGDNGSGFVAGAGSPATTSAKVDISAYALAVEAGYLLSNVAWSPRVVIEYDYATGSDSGKEDNTFDNLYPTNHAFYGYMDYQGWMNMSDIALKVTAKPSDKCWLYLAYHMFSLAEDKDNWYQANGSTKMSGNIGEDAVGTEIDLLARHTFNQNLKVEAGLSEFFAGNFIKNHASTSDDEDSTWAYLMGTVSF